MTDAEVLQRFLQSHRRNEWLMMKDMEIYLRKGLRWLGNEKIDSVITVANINVRADKRGTGVFTRFLDTIEDLGMTVWVESIQEKRLIPFLKSRGYIMAGDTDMVKGS